MPASPGRHRPPSDRRQTCRSAGPRPARRAACAEDVARRWQSTPASGPPPPPRSARPERVARGSSAEVDGPPPSRPSQTARTRPASGCCLTSVSLSVNHSTDLLNDVSLKQSRQVLRSQRAVTVSQILFANEPVIRLGAFAGVLAAMALWEVLAPRRHQKIGRGWRWPNNLGIVMLDTLLVRLVFATAAVGMALLAETQGWGLFHALEAPAWLAVV